VMWARVDGCLGEGATVSSLHATLSCWGARVRGWYVLCALVGDGVHGLRMCICLQVPAGAGVAAFVRG
jgi:galactokinase